VAIAIENLPDAAEEWPEVNFCARENVLGMQRVPARTNVFFLGQAMRRAKMFAKARS